ncbi:autotransporter-associated beta strand repeat-containing protein [Candidatus Odyssella thessalonicensis]|uniref:autotransporter-associated beta strand repeat-containing protein n=1 Tax=Candidatus Odyssella thessalonicensis TaxID=84647 RepID=UPI000225AC7E|nr:autotransporter-associated beta strand repeat-containing protein [Candidatus Odyssella thessalonicensis]
MGAGGAGFINGYSTVTYNNVTFTNCLAVGRAGNNSINSAGGGGGMGGNAGGPGIGGGGGGGLGGNGSSSATAGGAGGGIGGNGGTSSTGGCGGGGFGGRGIGQIINPAIIPLFNNMYAGNGCSGGSGGNYGGGGGGGGTGASAGSNAYTAYNGSDGRGGNGGSSMSCGGGGGGIGGVTTTNSEGGNGGFGGGGGASYAGNGGNGGFGGGGAGGIGSGVGGFGGGGGGGAGTSSAGGFGGGGGSSSHTTGAVGGFGGGGGCGGSSNSGGSGGFGGGTGGTNAYGGGGAGFGGALFVRKNGTLTLQGPITFSSNSVMGGAAGGGSATAGQAAGSDLFMMGGSTVTLDSTNSNITSNGSIADDYGNTGSTGGQLTIQGTNKVILNGANTYVGGTLLNSGTLAVGNSSALGTGTLILNGGTLQAAANSLTTSVPIQLNNNSSIDTQAYTFTCNGAISGTYNLTKAGSGTLILTGSSAGYSGATLINAGTLTLDTGASIATSSAVQLSPGATFDISAGNQTIQDLSGTGGTVNLGSSTLRAGTSNNTTYNGTFFGPGGVIKQGTGILTLTNTSSHLGPTLIDAGEVNLNGAFSNSPVTINPGATLSGNGTVYSLVNAGIVAPGNSIGQMGILTNYDNPSGTYTCEVDAAGQSDLIVVDGTTTLGGTLSIQPLPGAYQSGTPYIYTVLSSPNTPINGTFNTVTGTSPLFSYTPTYEPNAVQLTMFKTFNFSQVITSGNYAARH